MVEKTPKEQLELAKSHLSRVHTASWDPIDWTDIGNYGLYAIEAAVMAAAKATGLQIKPTHWAKAEAAENLVESQALPDVAVLMQRLNELRKSSNYGDIEAPDLDAEEVTSKIESYLDAVEQLIASQDDD